MAVLASKLLAIDRPRYGVKRDKAFSRGASMTELLKGGVEKEICDFEIGEHLFKPPKNIIIIANHVFTEHHNCHRRQQR